MSASWGAERLKRRESLYVDCGCCQDVTTIRRGIDETHGRFEDAFNRGDAEVRRGLEAGGWRLAPTRTSSQADLLQQGR
jgi:hypothetical protein